jgi:hypothetical protein
MRYCLCPSCRRLLTVRSIDAQELVKIAGPLRTAGRGTAGGSGGELSFPGLSVGLRLLSADL